MSHHLSLKGVCIALAGQHLLEITAEIGPGEVLTVKGPSGAGKSTLLSYVAGFLDPAFTASGDVRLDGESLLAVPPERRGLGLLFQDPLLFPHLSVGGNLRFAIPCAEASGGSALVEAVLAEAGLEGFAGRDVATLSGGQKARVAMLRLLLSKPRAALLDEPFSKLDAALRQEFRQYVFGRLKQAGLPAILVTHDEADAAEAGGPVIELGVFAELGSERAE
jgi:putative thiamine transport system ATP-binding protein